jgi:hypothetical protein
LNAIGAGGSRDSFGALALDAFEPRDGVRELIDHLMVGIALFQAAAPHRQHANGVDDVVIAHVVEGDFAAIARGPERDFAARRLDGHSDGVELAHECHGSPNSSARL